MCGGRERPPYRAGQTRRPTGKPQPPPRRSPVGDDARTAPAGAFRRPTGPQARLLGRRSSRGPCGGANARGRDKSLPYDHRKARSQPGKCPPPHRPPPVGADSISARGPRRIARLAGGACPSPINHGKRPTKRDGLHHPGGRRAGCPHPAAPRGAANTRGRIGNPPLRPAALCRTQTNKNRQPARGCRFCLQDGLNYSSILPNMAKSSPSSWMRWVVAGAWGLASGSRGASANSRAGTLDGRGPLP